MNEEVRSCCHSSEFVVNREVGLVSHSLSHSSPIPNKLCSFCGRKAPWKKKQKKEEVTPENSAIQKLSIIIVSHACWWPWPLFLCFQLSISKSGSGYLSIPVSQKAPTPSSPRLPSLPPSLSLVTTVEVCVKTQDTDGPVLLVKGNNSVWLCQN